MTGSWLHRPAIVTFGLRTCASVDWSISSGGCLGSEPLAGHLWLASFWLSSLSMLSLQCRGHLSVSI